METWLDSQCRSHLRPATSLIFCMMRRALYLIKHNRKASGCLTACQGLNAWEPVDIEHRASWVRGSRACGSTMPHDSRQFVCSMPGGRRFLSSAEAPEGHAQVARFVLYKGRELDQGDFNQLADTTLDELLGTLEDYLDELGLQDADIDYGQGVLTLKLGDKGTFVINKQAPNKQIWFSSPVSGPFRYDFVAGDWKYSRDGHRMLERLSSELRQLCGAPIEL